MNQDEPLQPKRLPFRWAPIRSRQSRSNRARGLNSSTRAQGAVVILVGLLAASFALPWLGWDSPNHQNLADALRAPSTSHPFGTDDLGRDVFIRTVAAAKLDLPVALAVTFVSLAIGLVAGIVAGFSGGAVDGLVMRVADTVLAVPFLVLVLSISAILGAGLGGYLIGVPLVGWAYYARLARAETLLVREKDYVLAATTLGYSRLRVLTRHVAPNVWKPAVTYSMADAVMNISALATLSFLGVGVDPSTPEWGAIVSDGQQLLLDAWWISTLPGVVLVLVGVCLSLVGDEVSERLGSELRIV